MMAVSYLHFRFLTCLCSSCNLRAADDMNAKILDQMNLTSCSVRSLGQVGIWWLQGNVARSVTVQGICVNVLVNLSFLSLLICKPLQINGTCFLYAFLSPNQVSKNWKVLRILIPTTENHSVDLPLDSRGKTCCFLYNCCPTPDYVVQVM